MRTMSTGKSFGKWPTEEASAQQILEGKGYGEKEKQRFCWRACIQLAGACVDWRARSCGDNRFFKLETRDDANGSREAMFRSTSQKNRKLKLECLIIVVSLAAKARFYLQREEMFMLRLKMPSW
ncbi:uncharacterized protein MONOS_17336 [Monocercomonoides exilis]|uniref:uncharacterized protein n=1 Tax=Monocercomonoides exilis TaxID=2049356 RepID=UPI0035596C51|nr:hypothetical protein MONOS_17336 [Monocercomonoides exilis]